MISSVAWKHNLEAAKSFVGELRAASGNGFSETDLLRFYEKSPTVYTVVNKRARYVASVPMYIADAQGNRVDNHPASAIFVNGSAFKNAQAKAEISLCLTGHSLLVPNPNVLGVFAEGTQNLISVSPRLYEIDADDFNGLRGFNVYGLEKRYSIPPYLEAEGGWLFTEPFDPFDDFDGVSPLEVSAESAGTQTELKTTQYNYYLNAMISAVLLQPAEDSVSRGELLKTAAQKLLSFVNRFMLGSHNAGRSTVLQDRWEALNIGGDPSKVMLKDVNADAREAICEAFEFPVALIGFDDPNRANSLAGVAFWKETWLAPRMDWYADNYASALSAWYGEPVYVKADLSKILTENAKEKIEQSTARANATFIDLYNAAKESGVLEPDERLRDMYRVGDVVVPISELSTVWQKKLQSTQQQPIAPLPQLTPPQATPIGPDKALEKPTGKSLWVGLSLASNPDLIDLQQAVRKLATDPAVQWTPPDEFHITLLYVPAVDEASAQGFAEALKDISYPEPTLKIGSVGTFDNVGEHALHFQVRRNAALLDYQAQLYDLAQEYGMQCSGYSDPLKYKPHVTVAYIPEHMKRVTYRGNVTVIPVGVICDYGDATLWQSQDAEQETEDNAVKSVYVSEAVFKEIEVAVRKAFKAQTFTPTLLTPHTAAYIQHMHEVGIAHPLIIEAAKAHYAGIAAAKSLSSVRSQFDTALVNLFRRAQSESISKSVFIDRMRTLLTRYAQLAIIAGIEDGGIEDFDLFDTEDENAVTALAWVESYTSEGGEQAGYIRGVADVLFSDNTLTDEEIADNKPILWWNKSLYPAYLEGLGIASKNGLYRWELGKTEKHCLSCLALNGQIRTYKFWEARVLPKSDALRCKGFKCDCALVPTRGKKNRGDLPAWKSHEHHEVIA